MHPLLKDRRALLLYLLVWLAFALMLAALMAIPGRISTAAALAFTAPLMLLYAFVSLSAWYICRAFPLATTNIARVLSANILASALSSVLLLAAALGWEEVIQWLLPGTGTPGWEMESLPLLAAAGVVLFLLASAVHYLLAAFDLARTAERNALQLQVLARDAELKALRAQIDPHFLFNSLNSISALTATDPPTARAMTLKLADFLRLSMSYGARDTVSLDEELSLARSFLDIEKVRFGNRLGIELDLDDEVCRCRVAPLILQPIVENAIGHGIAGLVDGGTIRIAGLSRNGKLVLTVENPADPGRPRNPGNGMGLSNVRKRLSGLYGAEGRLDVSDEPDRFVASISFPARSV
ncbi:MAG: histidine kinase [Bacteroidota bacterium]